MKNVTLYTDGACSGNPGPGGIGAVLLYRGRRKELSRGYRRTTNNRMEILALVAALEILTEPCAVELFTDSQYLLGAVQKNWLAGWKRNGWKTAAKAPVVNRDLWERLDRLLTLHTLSSCHWVKGHAANPENNRCDALAVAALRAGNLLTDEGYEATHPA